MSIKQNGGVFGRNPTFNDVTIEGQLTFDGDIDINSDLKVDGNVTADGLTVSTTGVTTAKIEGGQAKLQFFETDTVDQNFQIRLNGRDLITDQLSDAGAITKTVMRLDGPTGEAIFYDNIVIGTSGKGIDFSATAGTGTSELLDDYEEGAWTPVLSDAASGGNLATGTFDGIYTKVGNKVTVWLSASNINTSGMTGTADLYIQDLPFASGSGASKSTGAVRSDSITFANYLVSIVSSSASTMLIYNIGSNVADTPLNVQDITSGSGDIFTSVTYFV